MTTLRSEGEPLETGFNRRAFFFTAAASIAGLGALSFRRSMPDAETPEAMAAQPPHVSIAMFDERGQRKGVESVVKVVKPSGEWRKLLSAAEFAVARQHGTEPAYTGRYWNLHENGIYACVCCDTALFHSRDKFESHTGWPSFTAPIAPENIDTKVDTSFGIREEVLCKRCDGHLGHVFSDGPAPAYLRYCMNSAALRFHKIG